MTVNVELFGQLRNNREKSQNFDIKSPKTVSEVALLVGIQTEQIGMAVIDSRQVPLNEPVPESCRLSLFPPMTGG